jgi:hypothetical protein
MPKDGLRPLPAHLVAPLLRALMTIPRRPESRLYLRRAVPPRMHKTEEDYRVFRPTPGGVAPEVPIGNIWLDPHPETTEERINPWLWNIDTTRGGTDKEGWWASGRARTREEAMAALRNAWDNYQPRKPAAGTE